MESREPKRSEGKSKSIMLRFTVEEYTAIRAAAFGRGLEMGPMLVELLLPIVQLLKPPGERD